MSNIPDSPGAEVHSDKPYDEAIEVLDGDDASTPASTPANKLLKDGTSPISAVGGGLNAPGQNVMGGMPDPVAPVGVLGASSPGASPGGVLNPMGGGPMGGGLNPMGADPATAGPVIS